MNCLIVDDSEISLLEIKSLIKKVPFINKTETCSSAMDALPILLFGNIDILFLDVSMPEMTGFELINHLNGSRPQVIIISQERNYAAEGFDYNVTDFLIKPVSEFRFMRAISKAKTTYDNNHNYISKYKSLFIKKKSFPVCQN